MVEAIYAVDNRMGPLLEIVDSFDPPYLPVHARDQIAFGALTEHYPALVNDIRQVVRFGLDFDGVREALQVRVFSDREAMVFYRATRFIEGTDDWEECDGHDGH